MLKENEYLVIDNFLPENSMNVWDGIINGGGFPLFYAPNLMHVNTSNDDYFLHILYEDAFPQSQAFNSWIDIFRIKGGIKMNALADIKILWYPKTTKIYEYETFSATKGVVDNLIYFSDNNDGYIKLPDDTKIESIQNRLVLFKGNPTNVQHTTHTNGDLWLRCVTHIQCYLNEIPERQEKLAVY